MSYKEISKRKIAERNAKFNKAWLVPEDKLPGPEVKDVHDWPAKSGYLSAAEIEITECNPITILQKIKEKTWSAYEVTSAFSHRVTIAHQLVNCLTEIFIDEGLEAAKELDEYYAKTGQLKGPFHGLPVSLKDNQAVKGVCTSLGYTCLADSICDADSLIVSTLRSMGAVFYVKSNVPTAMMMLESDNMLWGKTMNPFNRDLCCGGSSGGEAVVVAMRGSAMGIGGDVGGSLRCPAGFQNLFTLRSSSGRLPTMGGRAVLSGFESIPSVNGPIATCIELVELYIKEFVKLGLNNIDPKVFDYGWKEDLVLPKKLKFAVCYDDNVVRLQPPVARGMKIVADALKKEGHEIVEWDPRDLHDRLQKLCPILYASGGTNTMKELAARTGEPVDFNKFYKLVTDQPEIGVGELWKLHGERYMILKEFNDQFFKLGIDALLMPIAPYPAGGHNEMEYIGYTSIFNALDWVSGTVPVTRADKDVDAKEEGYTPRNHYDEDCYNQYDPVKYHGGPVSVQVVSRRMGDEKVLKMMKLVADAVGTDDYWYKS